MKTQLVKFSDVLRAIRNGAKVLRAGGAVETALVWEDVAEQLDGLMPEPGPATHVSLATGLIDYGLIERGHWIAVCEKMAAELSAERCMGDGRLATVQEIVRRATCPTT